MEDLFDKDITVINKYINKETKQLNYKVSYLKGFWSSNDGISINGTQLTKQDGLSARILMNDSRNEAYQDPADFKKEPKTWTLQPDDYLVKGIVENFTTVTNLMDNYRNVIKITNVAIKDYGSKGMWHFVVAGA